MLTSVTGYQITNDTGAAGPTVGDDVSGGGSSLTFEEGLAVPLGRGVVNYASTVGSISGTFYEYSGNYYFVPDDDTGFPTGETGSTTSVSSPTEGTSGNDTLTGTAGRDVIFDTDGDIYDPTGNDSIDGGDGDDVIRFGDGNDTIDGGAGNDRIGAWFGGSGDNVLNGEAGDDVIIGGLGDDTMYGGDGDDFLSGGAGNDVMYGGSGMDQIWITDDHDSAVVFGGEGGADWDNIGFSNWDSTQGVNVTFTDDDGGTFSFIGTATNGTFDEIEQVTGTFYGDALDASASNQFIMLSGRGGDDSITGGNAGDTLEGDDGNDTLTGGQGDDWLEGGSGNDTFVIADGDGQDTIADFDLGDSNTDGFTNDQLDVSGLTDAGGDPVTFTDVVVSDDGSGNAILTFPNGESVRLMGVAPASVTQSQMVAMGVPCFVAGTRIRTPKGDVAVESLRAGDLVNTADNGAQPVVWVARQTVSRQSLRVQPKTRPVLIRKGALDNSRDLLVSRQHAMLVRSNQHTEGLARAIQLSRHAGSGFSVVKNLESLTYVHLMFDQHQIIFSEGALTESFYPGPFGLSSLNFLNRLSLLRQRPELLEPTDIVTKYGAPARQMLRRCDIERQDARTFS